MGSSSNKTSTTASNEPWAAAQPALKTGIGDATNLYQSGIGAQPYTGSTVVPYASQTTQGMNSIQGLASSNMGGQGLSGQYQNAINAGGFNAPQQNAMSYLNGIGDNPFDLSQNGAYQQYRDQTMNKTRDMVNENAAAAGRYGSGMHTDNLATSLGNVGNQMDLAQMQRMDALNTQRFNAGQQGLNNLGTLYQNMRAPAEDLMNVGSMYEDLYGRTLNDQLRIFNEQQQLPWDNLARMNAIASGAGQLGGTSSGVSQMPGQNPFATTLGYATTGLGLLGSLF